MLLSLRQMSQSEQMFPGSICQLISKMSFCFSRVCKVAAKLHQTLIIVISAPASFQCPCAQAIIIKVREADLTRCAHIFVMQQGNVDGMAAGQTCALLLITCSQEENWNSLEMPSPLSSQKEMETAALVPC